MDEKWLNAVPECFAEVGLHTTIVFFKPDSKRFIDIWRICKLHKVFCMQYLHSRPVFLFYSSNLANKSLHMFFWFFLKSSTFFWIPPRTLSSRCFFQVGGVVWAKLFTPPTFLTAKIKPQQLPPLTHVPHPKPSNQQQQPVIYGAVHKQPSSKYGKIMDGTVFLLYHIHCNFWEQFLHYGQFWFFKKYFKTNYHAPVVFCYIVPIWWGFFILTQIVLKHFKVAH